MAPAQRRGPWVPEEDQILLQLVRTQGPNNWVRISQHMKYRSPKQCRERFHQNLKPTLNHDPITPAEGAMIERMVNEMGKRWAEIARRLGNRSDNAVKNWWNGSMNRKRRSGMSSSSAAHAQRTQNGRVEPPYRKSYVNSPAITTTEPCRLPLPPPEPSDRSVSWTQPSDNYRPPSSPVRLPAISSAPNCPPSRARIYIGSEARTELAPALVAHDQGLSRKDEYIRAPVVSRPKLAPIVTYRPPSRPDVALISPSPSEISNRNSIPPSMISDHNSIASGSPTAATSPPLPSLPAEFHGFDNHRRGSASSTPSFILNSINHSDNRCIPGTLTNVECHSDLGSNRQWEHIPSPLRPVAGDGDGNSSRCGPFHTNSASHTPPAGSKFQQHLSSLSSGRDARMGVQALLN
ncbi:hypothetical protein VTO42DRAFT_6715 [Malbranchea cinnamomea]